ncbi:potassium transporter TrkG [Thalassobaculum salexigens]|uniref:potassium transporter TrkG n=1 Tax=Thalassobaculum salexigens TaxID=455360 RepID=UPI00248F3AE0|nr:potassium transporter TrkG [Thalassobaculum salexigens]
MPDFLQLTLFPPGALQSSVITTVWVGVCVVVFLNARFGTTLAGLVVPGYLVPLFFVKPASAMVVLVEAYITYGLAWLLANKLMVRFGYSEMFGRDRFFALILLSVLVRICLDFFAIPLAIEFTGDWFGEYDLRNNLQSFGLIIVALIANQMWMGGIVKGSKSLFLYLGLTFVCAVALWLAGMDGFDAVAHAMTTIATGGYSTKDASVGYFNTPAIDWIITVGMIVGSLPFVHYLRIARGDTRSILRDSQVRWFLSIVVICVALVTLWILTQIGLGSQDALRYAAFNVVSVITGTGYATTDFGAWGGFVTTMMLILMFVGGCAGSTTCGIKIFRFQVLYATAKVQLARLLRPHGVFIPYYNRKPIPEAVSEAVMGFFFLYILCFGLVAMALAAMGLDFITAMSGSATAISNVGPGLGPIIGPAGNFDPLPDAAKWLLCFAMLLGRLELFTVLVLITPTFWRK